jgi:hypothetical protein
MGLDYFDDANKLIIRESASFHPFIAKSFFCVGREFVDMMILVNLGGEAT